MELLNLLYNILLLLLYSIPLTLGFVLYSQGRKRVYLYTCILFIALIVDNTTIYMTEFLPWFSSLYDHFLLSVPTVKTILYAVSLGSTMLILTVLLKKEQSCILWICLVFIILFQLYTPIMPDGPWKVWIYYFPAQFFMFFIGSYGIYTHKKNPDSYPTESDRTFYKILIFYTIMAIAITIEDSIVIFHFDIYTPLEIKIRKRSLTQDIMNIGTAFYAIRLLYTKLSNALTATCYPANDISGQYVSARSVSVESPDGHSSENIPEQSVDSTTDHASNTASKIPMEPYSKLYLFVKKYQFTAREEEILLLLLENKNNQEISDTLMISIGTTKAHIHNIFQKLGIRKRQQFFDLYQKFDTEKS